MTDSFLFSYVRFCSAVFVISCGVLAAAAGLGMAVGSA